MHATLTPCAREQIKGLLQVVVGAERVGVAPSGIVFPRPEPLNHRSRRVRAWTVWVPRQARLQNLQGSLGPLCFGLEGERFASA
jgi:hypothetical protein